MGKSRLVYECVHSYRTQGWLVLESASVSYGKATPYFPVLDLLKRYCHIEERDDPRTIRAKVTGQVLTLDEALQDTVPALLALLDTLPDNDPFLRLDPPQRRQRTLEALTRVLLRESQVQPLLLVFEDLHWIDTETQALLDRLVESLPTARLLLLVNYRPEYQHGWASKTYYAQLRLDPLPPASAEELLATLLGHDPSVQPLTQLLIARTQGNPFFLEESVRTLVEAEVLVGTPGAYRLAQALPAIQAPATVQAVLAARIDRLPADAKHLLQTAAVIGHEVPLVLLQAVADLAEEALHRSLAQLQGAEFLYETRLFPEREYTFKHALTHEVAYGSLLQERRRVLHAQIVQALEALAADRVAEQVERLAHHALRGEVWDKAVAYCRQAGEKAMTQPAFREAVTCFEQALLAAQRLPTSVTSSRRASISASILTRAPSTWGPRRGFDSLREAAALAEELDDQQRLGRISNSLAHYVWRMGDYSGHRVRSACAGPYHSQRGCRRSGESTGCWARSTALWGTIVEPRTCSAEHGIRSRRPAPGALRGLRASLCAIPLLVGAYASQNSGNLPRGGPPARKPCGLPRPPSISAVRSLPSPGSANWPCAKAISPRPSSCSNGPSPAVAQRTLPSSHTRIAGHLGLAYALSGRVAEALPLFEQVVEQAMASTSGSMRRCWRARDICWLATWTKLMPWRNGPWGSPGPIRNGATRPRPCGSWARSLAHGHPPESSRPKLHYRQALALAEELGMRPLQAHCHLRPRHSICHAGTARAGPHRPVHRHRPIPRHGHDLLAASGRGDAGTGKRLIRRRNIAHRGE